MAHFDLNQYQTVQERIDLFWEKYPGGRFDLQIVNLTETQVIIRAQVWTDKSEKYPTTVDFAEERIGTSPVNKISHVENCSTSALGRAISALGNEFSPKGKRPSREEMEKVARGVPKRFFIDEAEALGKDLDKLRLLYSEAKTANASEEVLGRIKELAALAGA
jgi:hypothetical protein